MKRQKSKPIVKEKSCGIILFRVEKGERQYLFMHYPGGHWDYAKGHVEERDRSERETAARELEEETGITQIEFIEGYREPMYYDFHRGKKELVQKTVVYFLAQTTSDDIQLSHEHQGSIWLPYQEGMDQLTFDNARDLLEKAENHLNGSVSNDGLF